MLSRFWSRSRSNLVPGLGSGPSLPKQANRLDHSGQPTPAGIRIHELPCIRSFDLEVTFDHLHPSPHSPIIPALSRTFSFSILSHPLQSFYTLASFRHTLPSLSFSHPLSYRKIHPLHLSLSFLLSLPLAQTCPASWPYLFKSGWG